MEHAGDYEHAYACVRVRRSVAGASGPGSWCLTPPWRSRTSPDRLLSCRIVTVGIRTVARESADRAFLGLHTRAS
jgi:hypothetical protein